jgi:hypothetical protein
MLTHGWITLLDVVLCGFLHKIQASRKQGFDLCIVQIAGGRKVRLGQGSETLVMLEKKQIITPHIFP